MALGLGPHERLSTLVAKQPDLYDPYRWMCIGNSSTSSPTPFPTQFVVLLHSWVGNIKLKFMIRFYSEQNFQPEKKNLDRSVFFYQSKI